MDPQNQDPPIIALRQLLTAPAAAPLIAPLIEDRMYPVQAPDSTPAPYVVYSQLSEEMTPTKDGNVPNGWAFDVAIYADNALAAKKIGRAVRNAVAEKTTTVEGIGKLLLVFDDEMDLDYDAKRELFTIGLMFRAFKT